MTDINTDGSKLLSDALPRPKPNQKHSQSFVEAAFKERGWELLSQYESAHKKLNFICDKGHQHAITWANFKQNRSCIYCLGRVVTQEFVQSEFAKAGYTLHSQYNTSKDKLDFTCDKGHQHQIRWSDFKRGNRCAFCAGLAVTQEFVQSEFAKVGYALHSQYEGTNEHLDFTCDKGHQHKISWHSFQRGTRCAYCAESGYSPRISGRLYYIRFDFADRPPLYKIGITNSTIEKRFQKEATPYTILLDEWHKDGSIPAKKEKSILKRYKKYQYKGPKLLESGDTECFTKDVLGLDKPLAQLPLPLDIA